MTLLVRESDHPELTQLLNQYPVKYSLLNPRHILELKLHLYLCHRHLQVLSFISDPHHHHHLQVLSFISDLLHHHHHHQDPAIHEAGGRVEENWWSLAINFREKKLTPEETAELKRDWRRFLEEYKAELSKILEKDPLSDKFPCNNCDKLVTRQGFIRHLTLQGCSAMKPEVKWGNYFKMFSNKFV